MAGACVLWLGTLTRTIPVNGMDWSLLWIPTRVGFVSHAPQPTGILITGFDSDVTPLETEAFMLHVTLACLFSLFLPEAHHEL